MRTARGADCIIVPSRGTARDTRVRFFGRGERIEVIPNGIDAEAIRAAAAEPAPGLERLPEGLPLLCVAARLSVEKDVGLLVDAVHRVQSAHPCALAIVGDGPERAALEQRVSDLGLSDRIAFIGHRENAYPYMRAADIYVHTCQFEGFGYTMAEAMACGTPVIATDCPHGPREVLDEGKCGVLVAPGDPRALADGLAAVEHVGQTAGHQPVLNGVQTRRAFGMPLPHLVSPAIPVGEITGHQAHQFFTVMFAACTSTLKSPNF